MLLITMTIPTIQLDTFADRWLCGWCRTDRGSASTSPNGCRQTGAATTAPSNWGYAGWSGSS